MARAFFAWAHPPFWPLSPRLGAEHLGPRPLAGLVKNSTQAQGKLIQTNTIVMTSSLLEEASKVIPSQQPLVNLVSKRVRQLTAGQRPLVKVGAKTGFSDIALLEIISGKLRGMVSGGDLAAPSSLRQMNRENEQRMHDLLERNRNDALNAKEQVELDDLVDESEAIALENARSLPNAELAAGLNLPPTKSGASY